jgi:hypothetical protein
MASISDIFAILIIFYLNLEQSIIVGYQFSYLCDFEKSESFLKYQSCSQSLPKQSKCFCQILVVFRKKHFKAEEKSLYFDTFRVLKIFSSFVKLCKTMTMSNGDFFLCSCHLIQRFISILKTIFLLLIDPISSLLHFSLNKCFDVQRIRYFQIDSKKINIIYSKYFQYNSNRGRKKANQYDFDSALICT